MKWYHFSVEYFEDLRNVNHCEFLIMRKSSDSGKFILENQLRTWSELRRERQAIAAAKPANKTDGMSEKDKEKEAKLLGASTGSSTPVPARKKWGGCPNGCDHAKHYFKKENSMHAMQLNGKPLPMISSTFGTPPDTIASRRPASRRMQSSSDEDEDDPRGRGTPAELDVQKSLDEVISSPDGTPSFITMEDRLRSRLKSPNELLSVRHGHMDSLFSAGRDGGGSASGANSDAEFSAEEDARKRLARGRERERNGNANGNGMSGLGQSSRRLLREDSSGMKRGAKADALGDQSDAGSEGEDICDVDACDSPEREGAQSPELTTLEMEEKLDKSIKGSVY